MVSLLDRNAVCEKDVAMPKQDKLLLLMTWVLIAANLEGCELPKRIGYYSPLPYHFLCLLQSRYLLGNISQHYLLECVLMPNR